MSGLGHLNTEITYPSTVSAPNCEKPVSCTVWKGQPRNPSCGLVSLKGGARTFLQFYMVLMIILCAFYIVSLCLAGFYIASSANIPGLFANKTNVTAAEGNGLEQLMNYERRMLHGSLILFLVLVFLTTLSGYSAWKCKQALDQGIVAQMKKHFYVVFIFVVNDVLFFLFMDTGVWFTLIYAPIIVYSVIGVLFTYNYILERIKIGLCDTLRHASMGEEI